MRPSRTATCVASGRDGFIVRILRARKMVVLMRGFGWNEGAVWPATIARMSPLRRLLLLCLLAPLSGWAEDVTWSGPQTTLTLFADHSYRLRTGSGEAPAYDLGRWGREADGTLLLRGGREAPLRLSAAADGRLQLVDPQGRPSRRCSARPRSTASKARCACAACTSTWPTRPASRNA